MEQRIKQKVLEFLMKLKTFYNKYLFFTEKSIFNNAESYNKINFYYNILWMCSVYLFRATHLPSKSLF